MMKWIRRTIQRVENHPHSIYMVLLVALLVTCIRTVEEWLNHKLKVADLNFVLHGAAFYLAVYMMNLCSLSWILKKEWKSLSSVVSAGIVMGILPPILDLFNPYLEHQMYTYLENFSFLLTSPKESYGETITLWIWIVAATVYVGITTKEPKKTILAFILTYGIVQFTAWITGSSIVFLKKKTDIRIGHLFYCLWWLIVAIGLYILKNRTKFQRSFTRWHHALIWGALTLVGVKAVGDITFMSWIYAFIMSCSFLFIIFANDFYDRADDARALRASALDMDDLIYIFYCQVVLIGIAGIIDSFLFLCAFTFFLLSLAYHLPQLRFKKHFFYGSLIEGTAAILCLLAGASQYGAPQSPWFVVFVLLCGAGFAVASNLRDYKDFMSDLEAHIETVYVCLNRKGWKTKKSHQLISGILLVVLLIPCVWLYWMKVPVWSILSVAVLAVMTGILSAGLSKPARAVSWTIWMVLCYLLLIIWMMPKVS